MYAYYGNPVLHNPCAPYEFPLDDQSKHDIEVLKSDFASAGKTAIGLAMPQVMIPKRAIVVTYNNGETELMINPVIVEKSDSMFSSMEGCLSVRSGLQAKVQRHWAVVVQWKDEDANTHVRSFAGLESACVQHEIDHLDGIMFTDHLSGGQKKRIMRKIEKASK